MAIADGIAKAIYKAIYMRNGTGLLLSNNVIYCKSVQIEQTNTLDMLEKFLRYCI